VEFLEGMSKWMQLNGEGIFGTRPWKVFGEGPTQVKAGMFNEDLIKNFTTKDIRYTSKGKYLYAFLMKWPGEKGIRLRSLGFQSELVNGKSIKIVKLLGYKGKLKWNQTNDSLNISLPAGAPGENVSVLKIILE
jgi:alpha-L-fucosidase